MSAGARPDGVLLAQASTEIASSSESAGSGPCAKQVGAQDVGEHDRVAAAGFARRRHAQAAHRGAGVQQCTPATRRDRVRLLRDQKDNAGPPRPARPHPAGIEQEIYALLAVYQIIRIAIADATGSAPGTDPDRASFTIALEAALDPVIQAANVIATTVVDLVGTIGRHVLDNLMPDRRLRLSPRAVKRPISRYAYKSLKIDRRSYKAALAIDILTPAISP